MRMLNMPDGYRIQAKAHYDNEINIHLQVRQYRRTIFGKRKEVWVDVKSQTSYPDEDSILATASNLIQLYYRDVDRRKEVKSMINEINEYYQGKS